MKKTIELTHEDIEELIKTVFSKEENAILTFYVRESESGPRITADLVIED